MTVTTPHFAAPFSLDEDGRPVYVQQDSPSDIQACVFNVVICPLNTKLGDPAFGVPSLLFKSAPLVTSSMVAAIQRLEPRATVDIIATGLSTQNVQINVQP